MCQPTGALTPVSCYQFGHLFCRVSRAQEGSHWVDCTANVLCHGPKCALLKSAVSWTKECVVQYRTVVVAFIWQGNCAVRQIKDYFLYWVQWEHHSIEMPCQLASMAASIPKRLLWSNSAVSPKAKGVKHTWEISITLTQFSSGNWLFQSRVAFIFIKQHTSISLTWTISYLLNSLDPIWHNNLLMSG